MDAKKAYELFEEMISVAQKSLVDFTLNSKLSIEQKADKSLVTDCDKQIDMALTNMAQKIGLQVVSEEGKHVLEIVKSGDYMTIDPIDGTLGYIDNVNYALQTGGIKNFLQKDLGPEYDFSLLLGIVEDGVPCFGACYNYVTCEKILIDGSNKDNLIRENNVRCNVGKNVVYLDKRISEDPIINELVSMPDVLSIKQATFGLKSLYTLINSHENAIMLHRIQSAGLWDVMPAAVASQVFGGEIYDELGQPLKFKEYIMVPGKGGVIIKGSKFRFVLDRIKNGN